MSTINRREMIAGTLAGAVSLPLMAQTKRVSDLIKVENEKEGTTDWQLTYTRIDPKTKSTKFGGFGGRSTLIEGYCSKQSVKLGESIDFFVSTDPASPFHIDIYRLGYYQGRGARHMKRIGPFDGEVQATPEVDKERLRECRWKKCTSFEIPNDWVSGVYLGKLSATKHRYQSYVIFIVKDERPADFLFQVSDNTWQAYNAWPDNYSLYINDREDKRPLVSGVRVSFDRPYAKYTQIMDFSQSQGSGEFLLWEFPLAYWMEEQGYDVSYISNSDVHANPKELLRGKGFLSIGHDEYWSLEQYNHAMAAVQAGVNMCFLSGNSVCMVTPFSPSSSGAANRILTRAGRFGGVRPGEEKWMDGLTLKAPNESTLIGAQTVTPFNGSGDWIVTKPEHWIFEGTKMKKGDKIPGLVGWEFHGSPADIPGLEVVAAGKTFTGNDVESHYTATIYPGPKKNFVFNAATIFWAQGLAAPPGHVPPISHHGRPHGPDERVRRITKNVFDRIRAV
ncbi:MAG: hypothetical protein K8T89_04210 [Planctomycetes bacterium]|nr:hypothetical protein [Planctomycetota bacterium]